MKDLEERLAVLQHKRQEDKARMKELERYKAQAQQVCVCVCVCVCVRACVRACVRVCVLCVYVHNMVTNYFSSRNLWSIFKERLVNSSRSKTVW